MKSIKTATIAILCTLLMMTSCSRNIPASSFAAMEIVARSVEAMKNVDNYKAVMTVEMSTDKSYETARITSHMDVFLHPLKIRMLSNIDEPTIGVIDMATFFVQENDQIAVYMNIFQNWTKSTHPFDEALISQYSPEYSELFNEKMKSAYILSGEKINGADCWKIKLSLDPGGLTDILNGIQITQGLSETLNDELLATMTDMPATVWIAKDSYYQIKADMDISAAMGNVFTAIESDISTLKISVTLSDFGHAADFTLPDLRAP